MGYKRLKSGPAVYFIAIGLAIFLSVFTIFLYINQPLPSIYIFPENPKQGDTVFIRVKTNASELAGNFNKEELVFYKKSPNEWISFLGIDVNQDPGNYKIYANTSNAEHLIKDISVVLADYSLAPTVPAPSYKKTGITAEKAISNIAKNDGPALKAVLGKFTSVPYFKAPFSFPLNKVEVTGYAFGKSIGFSGTNLRHLGVDLKAPKGTDIHAINDGKVVATLNLSNYGKTVIIDHGLNIFSLYLHLEEFKVAKGDMAKQGQVIGLSGDTGYVTAPHLHFSIRDGESRVDPIAFIEATQKINSNFILADISEAFKSIFK